jgi:hypothetical protein
MALARLVTFVPLTLIKSADVNGEFNNILNNPISLISPTTGPINFSLVAHTNLIPAAITATSGSTGQLLTVSAAGSPIWATFGSLSSQGVRILQVQSGTAVSANVTSTTAQTDVGIQIQMTPASTGSRIAILYAMNAHAQLTAGANQNLVIGIATSSGAIPNAAHTVGAPSAAGGIGLDADIAFNVLVNASTGPYPTSYKVQGQQGFSSGGASTLNNFNGILVELSS